MIRHFMSAPKFVSIESQNKIVEDYKKIKNVTKTAKLYNCSKGAIRNILKKHDCETHQRDISTEALIKHSKDIFENHEKYKHLNEVTIRRHAKRLLIHINGNICSICQTTEWLGCKVPLVCDHIDGNTNNSKFENFRLVCGNCDALLPTFKSKNRGFGRTLRKIQKQEVETN